MEVVLAESLGMCFGVQDAIGLALRAPVGLTVLGELVHNRQVLATLAGAGVRLADGLTAAPATERVMITAHGAAQRRIAALQAQGLQVEDATCPLVRHAHRSLARLVEEGYFPVVIGRPDHVEVRGLVEDFERCSVVQEEADLDLLAGHDRLGIISQTTQPLELVLHLVERIRARYPQVEVRFVDTVCAPTKERQEAARRLGLACPVVVVVGGRHSNNTQQLVQTCTAGGARTYQVEGPDELEEEWFRDAAGCLVDRVGLTAGTSTPDEVIQAVHRGLLALADPVSWRSAA